MRWRLIVVGLMIVGVSCQSGDQSQTRRLLASLTVRIEADDGLHLVTFDPRDFHEDRESLVATSELKVDDLADLTAWHIAIESDGFAIIRSATYPYSTAPPVLEAVGELVLDASTSDCEIGVRLGRPQDALVDVVVDVFCR